VVDLRFDQVISFTDFFALVLSVSLVSALATLSEDTRGIDLAKRGASLSTQFATDSTVPIFDPLGGSLNSLGLHRRASAYMFNHQ